MGELWYLRVSLETGSVSIEYSREAFNGDVQGTYEWSVRMVRYFRADDTFPSMDDMMVTEKRTENVKTIPDFLDNGTGASTLGKMTIKVKLRYCALLVQCSLVLQLTSWRGSFLRLENTSAVFLEALTASFHLSLESDNCTVRRRVLQVLFLSDQLNAAVRKCPKRITVLSVCGFGRIHILVLGLSCVFPLLWCMIGFLLRVLCCRFCCWSVSVCFLLVFGVLVSMLDERHHVRSARWTGSWFPALHVWHVFVVVDKPGWFTCRQSLCVV